jgi:hypothetical protein
MYSKYTFNSIFSIVPPQEYYDISGGTLVDVTIHANGTTYPGKWAIGGTATKITTAPKLRASETKLNNVLADINKILTTTSSSVSSGNTLEVRAGTSVGWSGITTKTANVSADILTDGSYDTRVTYACDQFYTTDGTKRWLKLAGMPGPYTGAGNLGSSHVYMQSAYIYNPLTSPPAGASTSLTGIKTYYFVSSNYSNPIYMEMKFVFDRAAVHPYALKFTTYRYINGTATTLTSATTRDASYQYNINIQGDNDVSFPADITSPVDNPGTICIASSKYHLMVMGRTNITAPLYSGYLFSSFLSSNDWLNTFNNSASTTTRIPTWCEIPINSNGLFLPMNVYSAAKISALKVNTTIGTSAITVSTGSSAKYQLYTLSGLSKTQEATVAYGPTSDALLLFKLNVVDATTGMMGDISELAKAYLLVGNIPEDETEIIVDGVTYITFQNICVPKE